MSKLNAGEVLVKIYNEETGFTKEIVLKPTMRCAQMISRNFGGFGPARTALASEVMEAALYVLRIGSGFSDKDTKDWDKLIYENGMNADLLVPLIKYVGVLANGGKPLPDDPDTAGNENENESERAVSGN